MASVSIDFLNSPLIENCVTGINLKHNNYRIDGHQEHFSEVNL